MDIRKLFNKIADLFKTETITAERTETVREESKTTITSEDTVHGTRKKVMLADGKVFLDGDEVTGKKADNLKKALETASKEMDKVGWAMDDTGKKLSSAGKKLDKIFKKI